MKPKVKHLWINTSVYLKKKCLLFNNLGDQDNTSNCRDERSRNTGREVSKCKVNLKVLSFDDAN